MGTTTDRQLQAAGTDDSRRLLGIRARPALRAARLDRSLGLTKETNMRRPSINITPTERLARVAVGLVGGIVGVWLLMSVSGVGLAILELLLVVAALDLLVTGALGHCPLYRRLGHVPRSLRRE
jgi:hypothetical protein